MITYGTNDLLHWNYFLALERDMEVVSRYIEFSNANNTVYSIELAKILMAASSECDVMFKLLCSNFSQSPSNIDGYRTCLMANCPEIAQEEYHLPRFSLSSCPLDNWLNNPASNPFWWRSYNQVKHERNIHYPEANLKNTLGAMGTLLICNLYYLQYKNGMPSLKETTLHLSPETNLFRLEEKHYYSTLAV